MGVLLPLVQSIRIRLRSAEAPSRTGVKCLLGLYVLGVALLVTMVVLWTLDLVGILNGTIRSDNGCLHVCDL